VFLSFFTLNKMQHSIALKLLKVVFSFYFIITFVLTLGHMFAEWESAKKNVRTELTHLQNIFESGLAAAVWSFENDLIISTANGLLQSPIITGYQIIASNADYHWEAGTIEELSGKKVFIENAYILNNNLSERLKNFLSSKLIDYSFQLKHTTVIGQETVLAVVKVFTSQSIILGQVEVSFLFIVINALLKTCALWCLFLWAGNKYLSKPINTLINKTQNVDFESCENYIIAGDSIEDYTEIKVLENSFNNMLVNLQVAIKNRNQVEAELKQSERYLYDIINSMPALIVGLNEKQEVTHWNQAVEKFTKITLEDAQGLYVLRVLPFLYENIALIEDAYKKGQVKKSQHIFVYINELKFYFNLIVYPLSYSTSKSILFLEDVTERVHLENRVVLHEKMNSLGTLAAGMAHEINNPLGAILQGAQNIARRFDPQLESNKEIAEHCGVDLLKLQNYMIKREIPVFLNGIRMVSERAALIIRSVLKFSRNVESKMAVNNIHTIIEDAIAIAALDYTLIKETNFKRIGVVKSFDLTIPNILCANEEMQLVFLNILKNSAYALLLKKNSYVPRISIMTQVYKNQLRIMISDNGIGMGPDIKNRAFEPFFTTQPSNVGLGLSIVYFIIVEKLKGKVELESSPGLGTQIIIELPLG